MSDEDKDYALTGGEELEEIEAPALPYQPQFPEGEKLGIGLIGTGGITEQHLTAYKKYGLDVRVLCNRTLEKAEAKRDEFYPGADVTSDPDEALKRDDIAVVDIT